MPARRLKEFLEHNHVPYRVIRHDAAFTSQESAEAAHESGKAFAKTVMLKIDGQMAMLVIQADHKVDLDHLRQALGTCDVELAHKDEFRRLFPDCEPGAMPPFSELYGIEVFIDERFAEHEMICFSAGTHRETIKMPYADFIRIARAKPLRFILVYTKE